MFVTAPFFFFYYILYLKVLPVINFFINVFRFLCSITFFQMALILLMVKTLSIHVTNRFMVTSSIFWVKDSTCRCILIFCLFYFLFMLFVVIYLICIYFICFFSTKQNYNFNFWFIFFSQQFLKTRALKIN